ncbi:hypothetical protein PANT_22d00115 [Moesziomyces antarcticus T-34]|uniref:Uncharacterized protein n=1 Tax=Pseudozyma antarctica (strain T-34) TaxID=1151754 RepID=M9MI39_PSEA3|nr:hypothetical protein PANT_22d00115 [Moesziomyces antarcticus T-34]
MSEERSGEGAVASPPPAEQKAATTVDAPGHTNDASADASSSLTAHDSNATSAVPASSSERDVEALTGVHERTEPSLDSNAASSAASHNAAASAAAAAAAQAAGAPLKKFTSLNVNKRFLEKAGPTPAASSPTLKLGTSVSPSPSHRLSSPLTSSRLTSAKLSSVPKPQPAGWATTKPSTPTLKAATASPQPAATGPASTASVTVADSAAAAQPGSSGPLPSEASAPPPKAVTSPKPANSAAVQSASASTGAAASGAAASPRLVSMGRDSPRPGSAGLESGSGQGRASPGLRNAALGSSLRAASPASVSRAPWAGVKSSLSPNPTPAARGSTLSDFPTAAEAARAKQEQEEKAAAAAAREAAKQQAALQALDRFRGTSLGSGKHWDEMEDEDGGFLGEVVEFGDGSQYKIPTHANNDARDNDDDGPPISKEDRFKDVSHDRSWPQRQPTRPSAAAPNERPRPAAAQPPAWGPMRNRDVPPPATGESGQAAARPSRSEQRAERVIIPTTGASVSLRSPIESRDSSAYSYGRDRRPGAGGPGGYGGRQDAPAPPAAQAASAQAARAWGPLAQRQASLNPGAAPPPAAPVKAAPSAEPNALPQPKPAPAAPEPHRPAAVPASAQQQPPHQQQLQQEAPRAILPPRERASVPTREAPAPAMSPATTNGRPLPPHLASAGPAAPASRPLPPHLAQNLRPVAPAAPVDTVGRKTSHAIEEMPRSSGPQEPVVPRADGPARPPWGPKAAATTARPPVADAAGAEASAPVSSAAPPAPPSAPEEDVHAAIERARKRREEEEKARLAEKERAKQKALAIEERIKAAQQQREREAAAQKAAAQKRAVEEAAAAAATVAAAASAAAAENAAARKQAPADTAASWRNSRPVDAAADPARSRRQPAPAAPKDQIVTPSQDLAANQAGTERQPSRREQREALRRDQARARAEERKEAVSAARTTPADSAAKPEAVAARVDAVDAPKTILARPTRTASNPTAEERPREAASVPASVPRPQNSAQDATARASNWSGPSPNPSHSVPQDKPARKSSPPASKKAPTIAAPAPVRLYPVVPKEPQETRHEVVQDAPPAWNRFVVHLKASRSRPRLNRFQQKQLAARVAAMNAPGRHVYPLTWDPPLAHLSMKTLSRDDQLFPKRYHRGTVITPVNLPSRILPRGLASIVPQIVAQSPAFGARKQARFDLTPQWSELDRAGFGNGAAVEGQSAGVSPGGQIQVRLPGHHATVVPPGSVGSVPDRHSAAATSRHVDRATDAIIGEVLSSGGAPQQSSFEDRSRAFHVGAAPGSLGPLDYPQNGYAADAFGSHTAPGAFRSKGRRGSNAAVAFFDERQVNTPSPVSFMVNSEIKAEAGGPRGSLSPFGIPGSTRASQTQTPASSGSMLPSPSLSTQGTWGQSSLTFPVLEPRSANLADRDHIKSVWSLTTNSHSGELQNSLKDIGDDFLPSTMPMSVHDFRTDESRLTGAREEGGDRWGSSSFNRFQAYSRGAPDMGGDGRDLSPVANRPNGFDPTSRSPSASMDAAGVRAREAGQHHSVSSAYTSLGGSGAYAQHSSHQTSPYSPRERQQEGGNGLGQSGFSAYGGYSSGTSGNMSSMTTDALYGMSSYSGGSMTPNRTSYSQYGSHASAARSAPGSPYSGMSRHTSNLTSSVAGYSLFPSSGTAGGTRGSPASNGMDGLGVLDDSMAGTFGSGRNDFYGARGYQQASRYGSGSQAQPPSATSGAGGTGAKWPASSTASPSASGSVLRPAANVFNPQQKYSAGAQQKAKQQSQQQQAAQQQQQQEQQQERADDSGAHAAYASQYASAPYAGFSSTPGLW